MRALLDSGTQVIALARTAEGGARLAGAGAVVVRGDIGEAHRWARGAQDAEVIFHAGLPRIVPPIRRRRLSRVAREASAAAAILGAAAAGRPVVMASCAIASASGPLAIAGPARAAEQALSAADARFVRLPWAYGASGFLCDVSRGLQMRRFRMVGPAGNRVAVVGARDAAAALVAAASAPAGAYVVAEDDPPTQEQLVQHMCAARGAPRPDRIPLSMARMSMGPVFAEALGADQRVVRDPPPGFVPAQRWDRDMMDALRGAP